MKYCTRVTDLAACKNDFYRCMYRVFSDSSPMSVCIITCCIHNTETQVVAKSSILLDVKPVSEHGNCIFLLITTFSFLYYSGMMRQVRERDTKLDHKFIMALSQLSDIAEMERLVRSIFQDGLVWGACELAMFNIHCMVFHCLPLSKASTSRLWDQEASD